jgi:hypothetical protein
MKFIHFQCLKSWLNLKLMQKETPELASYYWKTFECEICKSIYPCTSCGRVIVCLSHSNVRYNLVDVPIPADRSFLLIETLNYERNASRIIHVLYPSQAKDVYHLGRGHEAEVKVTDISVSRLHARIRCQPEGYIIEDNNSKFGTLALIQQAELDLSLALAVQIGRTIARLSVQPLSLDPYFPCSIP